MAERRDARVAGGHDAVAAAALRGVQGAVGGDEQTLGVVALVVECRDTRADGQRGLIVGRVEVEVVGEALGERPRSRFAGPQEHDEELLAAEARRDVRSRARVAQHLGEALQRRVAGGMPERIVDAL